MYQNLTTIFLYPVQKSKFAEQKFVRSLNILFYFFSELSGLLICIANLKGASVTTFTDLGHFYHRGRKLFHLGCGTNLLATVVVRPAAVQTATVAE